MSDLYPLASKCVDNIATILEDFAAAQAEEEEGLFFEVTKNRNRPYIEEIRNKALVNIILFDIQPIDATAHGVSDRATIYIDMYARGKRCNLTPSDEVAIKRLHLLTGQVRYALTDKKNAYLGMNPREIKRDYKMPLYFYNNEPVGDEANESYAPARYMMNNDFVYTPADLTGLPTLGEFDIELLDEFKRAFKY